MLETDTALEAAGLSAAEIAEWQASKPEQTGGLAATSAATCAYLTRGEELLGRLPARPARTPAEARAAEVISATLNEVRAAFMRANADAVYAELTDGLRRTVRDEELGVRRGRALARAGAVADADGGRAGEAAAARRRASRSRRGCFCRSCSRRRARARISCGRCCGRRRRRSRVSTTSGRPASPISAARIWSGAGARRTSRSGTTVT